MGSKESKLKIDKIIPAFLTQEQYENVYEIFKLFDTSGDNKIQLSEAIAGFKAMHMQMEEYMLAKLIYLVDSDDDGQLSLQDFTRLFFIVKISQTDMKRQQELMMFFAADLNFNGKIDNDELQTICKKLGYQGIKKVEDEIDFEQFYKIISQFKTTQQK